MDSIGWGILGPGNIAKKFAKGLATMDDARLVAVGSRDAERASAFAEEFGAERAHGSYDALLADDGVDVVYVATPHPFHCAHSILCLKAGKPVLCEKPFTINEPEAREVVEVARSKDLFLMEGMWTRFVPALVAVQEWLAAGAIGEERMVQADFGFATKFNAEGRLFDPAMGGGGLLDVGVYAVSLASMVFGGEPVRTVGAAEIGQSGVDEQAAMVLQYDGGRLASLACGIRTRTPQHAHIIGSDGSIHIHSPFWSATKATLSVAGKDPETIELPYEATGFQFEAAEVGRCLREGKSESDAMPLDETLSIMKTLDRLRAEWGVRYPME